MVLCMSSILSIFCVLSVKACTAVVKDNDHGDGNSQTSTPRGPEPPNAIT